MLVLMLFGILSGTTITENEVALHQDCIPDEIFMRFNKDNFPFASLTEFVRKTEEFAHGVTARAIKTKYKGQTVVLKTFKTPKGENVKFINTEINVYQRLRGVKGIVHFHGCVLLNDESVVLILEDGGAAILEGDSPLHGTYLQKLSALKEIAEIFDAVANHNIVILDTKIDNILYNNDKKMFNAIDFGFACDTGGHYPLPHIIMMIAGRNNKITWRCDTYLHLWQYFLQIVLMHYALSNPELVFDNLTHLLSASDNFLALQKFHRSIKKELRYENQNFVNFILRGLHEDQKKRPQSFKEVAELLDVLYQDEEKRLSHRK